MSASLKNMLKSLLPLFLSTLICIFCAEFISVIWVKKNGDALQRALMVLGPDKRLGWKQKSNLQTTFEGKNVVTDSEGFRNDPEDKGDYEVIALGPSSTFGWGVHQRETYSAILTDSFSKKTFNAGQIGYGIVQGKILYEAIGNLPKFRSAKYVLIAYGVNDVDRFRFIGESPLNDEAYFSSPLPSQSIRAKLPWLGNTAFGSMLLRAWGETALYRSCGLQSLPELRLTERQFEKNLVELIKSVRKSGARPILLSTAFRPNVPTSEIDAASVALFYQKSVAAAKADRCEESRSLFKQGREREISRLFLDIKSLNASIERIAEIEKVPLLKPDQILDDSDGKNNFFDPVHPSALGHSKIARHLAELLRRDL